MSKRLSDYVSGGDARRVCHGRWRGAAAIRRDHGRSGGDGQQLPGLHGGYDRSSCSGHIRSRSASTRASPASWPTTSPASQKGILTALAMLNNQVAGHPLEYVKADNGSDPVRGGGQGPATRGERQDQLPGRTDLLARRSGRDRLPRQIQRDPAVFHRRPAERQPRRRPTNWRSCQRLVRFPGLLLRQVLSPSSSATRRPTASTTTTPPLISCRTASRRRSSTRAGHDHQRATTCRWTPSTSAPI